MSRKRQPVALGFSELVAQLNIADQFLRAARTCMKAGNLVHPPVVCFALAAELALKGLVGATAMSRGPTVRTDGHRLDVLFDLLHPSHQVDIVIAMETHPALMRERLEQFGSTFVLWRYAHEQAEPIGVSVEFLQRLATVSISLFARDLHQIPEERRQG